MAKSYVRPKEVGSVKGAYVEDGILHLEVALDYTGKKYTSAKGNVSDYNLAALLHDDNDLLTFADDTGVYAVRGLFVKHTPSGEEKAETENSDKTSRALVQALLDRGASPKEIADLLGDGDEEEEDEDEEEEDAIEAYGKVLYEGETIYIPKWPHRNVTSIKKVAQGDQALAKEFRAFLRKNGVKIPKKTGSLALTQKVAATFERV